MPKYSKLLIGSNPLQVLPDLAVKIGLNEAIVLQQVHYWLRENEDKPDHHKQGRVWTYNSFEEWREKNFPFWCERTIRTAFSRLERLGLILKGCFNKTGFDKTNWYTIEYDKVLELEAEETSEDTIITTSMRQDLPDGCGNSCLMDAANPTKPIPETNPETNPETSSGVPPPMLHPHPLLKKSEQEKTSKEKQEQGTKGKKGKEESDMKASEVLKHHQEQKGWREKSQVTGAGELASLWKKSLASTTDQYVSDLTMKERGQLGKLLSAAGEDAGPLLQHAVTHWHTFTIRAKHYSGESSAPALPHIGYLLKHWKTALAILNETTIKKPAVPHFDKSAAIPKTEEKLPTLQELLAIEAELTAQNTNA